MKTLGTSLVMLLIAGSVYAAGNREAEKFRDNHDIVDASYSVIHSSGPLCGSKADTIYVYGGHGTLEGKFQNAAGGCDPQGWTGIDDTQAPLVAWHVDTWGCGVLDPTVPDNHAWWCGQMIPSCGDGDPDGGYGNSWMEWIEWTGTVVDNTVETIVTVDFDLVYDSEPGYDGTTLQYDSAAGMVDVSYWDGADTLLTATYSFTVTAVDYVGDAGDEVRIRFEFGSDGGWSDEDCLWPTAGAARVDNIAVSFDGVPQGAVEDCENAATLQWVPATAAGVGDYFQIWQSLGDLDPCRENTTPVVAFLDDGLIVPGTGGSFCMSWCYSGPDGWVVNSTGGMSPFWDAYLRNRAVSPVISWSGDDYDGGSLAYDVYKHFDLSGSPMFYTWSVRSTADPAGLSGWSDWRDHGFLYYGGPGWERDEWVITSLLEPDCANIQVSLGVFEIFSWEWMLDDISPAPYFDNVCVVAFTHDGPALSAREIELAQDGFPDRNDVDYSNLGANSIRFDMARNIAPASDQRNDPGDSLVVMIIPIRPGSVLLGAPRMYYRFDTNPIFNTSRDAAFSSAGHVDGRQVYAVPGIPVENSFSFDLPDTGWFFPGDVIHYYFEAQDDWNGDIGTSMLPADTTGFSVFDADDPRYDDAFTVHGLPTVLDDNVSLYTPPLLLWNDGGRSVENEWRFALANLGFMRGRDYDVFYTNSPSSGVGNGLGGRATSAHLAGYDLIMYSSGMNGSLTITDADYDFDAGDDVGVLDAWLRLGDRNLLLSGDDLVSDMTNSGGSSAVFVEEWMGVSLFDDDLCPAINNQRAPVVCPETGGGVFEESDEWIAYGSCPSFRYFDAVEVSGSGQRLAHFLDPDGQDVYPYSAATLSYDPVHGATVLSLPYDFTTIYTVSKAPVPSAVRAKLLEDMLTYFGALASGPPAAIPDVVIAAVDVYPNPFNPQTRIAWTLPHDCRATVDVLDLRGRVVRTLVAGDLVAATGQRTWDGRDEAGSDVASGLYFARIRAAEMTKIVKLTLVR